jgi:hypothetical protein
LLILSSDRSKHSDSNLASLVSFLGGNVRISDSPTPSTFSAVSGVLAENSAMALSADTLAVLYSEESSRESVRERLLCFRSIFLYGIAAKAHDELLRWLSDGSLIAAETVSGVSHGEFPAASKRFSHQLSGTQYPRPKRATTCDVLVTGRDGPVPLIVVSTKPTFLSLQLGSCNVFVSTVAEIPDPNHRVMDEDDIEEHYDSLLPVLVFVRAAFGDYCWQGGWKGSRLIIDDPVLRRQYGMLNFARLLESIRHHRYSATVAYIPWNQPRTSRSMASFFNKAGERFSICVHGCDHTNNEYGSRDGDYLEQKSLLAKRRMQRHEDRTGLGFEPIMVFPQGRFSTACLSGLRSSDFLAAINSTRFPLDHDAAPVSLCELLLPAFNRVYGFPVFLRHYSTSNFPLLFDLFLGRPAFIVEHHEFFQRGFPSLETLADRLNGSEPELAWGSLAETVERTCWKRTVSPGHWEVRFFTDTFRITNNSQQPFSYRLLKDELDKETVTSIVLNGQTVQTSRRDRCIEIETDLLPGETAYIQLHRPKTHLTSAVGGGVLYKGKVLVRRVLSEFRDEFLIKHPAMFAPAKRIVGLLKATSDSVDSKKCAS